MVSFRVLVAASAALVAVASAAHVYTTTEPPTTTTMKSKKGYYAHPVDKCKGKTPAGERCAGEPGKPYVEWLGCCDGYECVADKKKGWGLFCKPAKAPKCYKEGERCIGAPGKPYVAYMECCGEDMWCAKDPKMGWGSFCKKMPKDYYSMPTEASTTVAPKKYYKYHHTTMAPTTASPKKHHKYYYPMTMAPTTASPKKHHKYYYPMTMAPTTAAPKKYYKYHHPMTMAPTTAAPKKYYKYHHPMTMAPTTAAPKKHYNYYGKRSAGNAAPAPSFMNALDDFVCEGGAPADVSEEFLEEQSFEMQAAMLMDACGATLSDADLRALLSLFCADFKEIDSASECRVASITEPTTERMLELDTVDRQLVPAPTTPTGASVTFEVQGPSEAAQALIDAAVEITGEAGTVTVTVVNGEPVEPTEPVATEPVATEPVATEAVTTEAVTTEAVTTEAVTTEAATTEPVTTEPATTVPVEPMESPEEE